MSFLYITEKPPSNRRIYLWGTEKVKTPKPLAKHLTINSDGSLLCIAYHYTQDGVTIIDQNNEQTTHVPITHCLNLSIMSITDKHLYIAEKGQVYKINFKGELMCRFGTLDSVISCLAIDPHGLIHIGNYNRRANFQGVLVYHSNGNFSHVLCRNIHPVDMAFDQKGDIHICDNRSNSIKVYCKKRKLKYTYGQDHLMNPTRVVTHPNHYCVVLESISLFVFDKEGNYLYEIDLDQNGILDFTITNDGTLWIIDTYFNLMKQQSNAIFSPPPSLQLLCQSTILLNMADLPISLLPTRYSSAFKNWSKLIQFELSINEGKVKKSGKMNIPPELNDQSLALILEERLGVPYTILSKYIKYVDNKIVIDINL